MIDPAILAVAVLGGLAGWWLHVLFDKLAGWLDVDPVELDDTLDRIRKL